MKNWLRNNDRTQQAQPAASPQLLKKWPLIMAILLAFCGLFAIATMIVLSTIPVYLSAKDIGSPTGINNDGKIFAMAFATNYIGNTPSGITNYKSVAQQINGYMGYRWNSIGIQSITLNGVGKRKKRDTTSDAFCNINNGTNYSTANGSAMEMSIIINNCPRTRCITNHCIQECLPEIKSHLSSVFGSDPVSLNLQTSDGQSPTCADGVQNGQETGPDCGGATCLSQEKTCANGLGCSSATDCTSRLCAGGLCRAPTIEPTVAPIAAPTCTDGLKNGLETDVDCGGATCVSQNKACADTLGCTSGTDCMSGVYTGGSCQAPTCTDGVKNGLETGVDCGGATCVSQNKACADTLGCTSGTDCMSGVCTSGSCQAPTCADGVKNGLETGVDCGGVTCVSQNKACADNVSCSTGTDCMSRICTSGSCQVSTCTDGVKNGLETGVDCGGATCVSQNKACADSLGCTSGTDCTSGVCTSGSCQAPTCTDGVKNGLETALDCGGNTCVSQNKQCADNLSCIIRTDCTSGVCTSGSCQTPTCTDGVKNGLETALDCGGSTCASQKKACADNVSCNTGIDCMSGVCTSGSCQAPTCTDGVKNGLETGVDCGGSICVSQGKKCADGSGCTMGSDCTSLGCNGGVCGG
ncbi:unnamed protein product [Adineta ricciae]|uniref:Uncharacterized protein n=1 Tax=Adineta ricciae TaxID=249248 RepID=A0A815EQF4_ADIRI|nr:unnamed protein product [Adineta ricciae]